jgi:hypothetical protein
MEVVCRYIDKQLQIVDERYLSNVGLGHGVTTFTYNSSVYEMLQKGENLHEAFGIKHLENGHENS